MLRRYLNQQQRHELDPVKRTALLVEMANIVNDDLPVGILEFVKGRVGFSTHLHNFYASTFMTLWSLPYVWSDR